MLTPALVFVSHGCRFATSAKSAEYVALCAYPLVAVYIRIPKDSAQQPDVDVTDVWVRITMLALPLADMI